MRRVVTFTIVAAISASFLPIGAAACGESLFRVGKGVHYRAFSAPIPGTVLVYARTEEEKAVAEQLRQAGHKVLVVENDGDLALQLHQQGFDVVVAPASKRVAVESSVSGSTSPPDWVPVYGANDSDVTAVRADYRYGVESDDDVRKYLKAIHKNLKNQRT
jgi:hypothetical protein